MISIYTHIICVNLVTLAQRAINAFIVGFPRRGTSKCVLFGNEAELTKSYQIVVSCLVFPRTENHVQANTRRIHPSDNRVPALEKKNLANKQTQKPVWYHIPYPFHIRQRCYVTPHQRRRRRERGDRTSISRQYRSRTGHAHRIRAEKRNSETKRNHYRRREGGAGYICIAPGRNCTPVRGSLRTKLDMIHAQLLPRHLARRGEAIPSHPISHHLMSPNRRRRWQALRRA